MKQKSTTTLHFLSQLEKAIQENSNLSLSEFYQQFKEKNTEFEIINENVIQMHLYSSIVLPWEQLKKTLPKKIKLSEINYEEWGYFKILNQNPSHAIHKMDLRFFIRKLRNAISHNNVFIHKDKSVVFRDKDQTKIRYEWEELIKLMGKLDDLLL